MILALLLIPIVAAVFVAYSAKRHITPYYPYCYSHKSYRDNHNGMEHRAKCVMEWLAYAG